MRKPFTDPGLTEPTPLCIDGDVIYGHVADWQAEHIGARGVHAPRNHSGYRYFHLGAYQLGGREIDCGTITMDTVHERNLRSSVEVTRQHYENTGKVAAYVRVGEDEHGIWCSGKLALGLDARDREALRGAKLSGDWRPINGRLELIGVLAVCIPGFPIPRPRALIASGQREPLALVAAGIVLGDDESDARLRLRARLARRKLRERLAK